MYWKKKALIQNFISSFPSSLSYAVYFFIQRNFGSLRRVNPVVSITAAVDTCRIICKQGKTISDKVFFEVGTGWMPIVPISYWLMGAKKTITIDLNPYLKPELTKESLDYIISNKEEILEVFGSLINEERLYILESVLKKNNDFSLSDVLSLCNIDYDCTRRCSRY